jgi:apolipoprotein N-acyltransferase
MKNEKTFAAYPSCHRSDVSNLSNVENATSKAIKRRELFFHFSLFIFNCFSAAVLSIAFRWYEGSLPVWFALAPVMAVVAAQRSKRLALLHGAAFALTWTWLSFDFLWSQTPAGAIALTIYTSLFYAAGLLIVRRLAREGPVLAVVGTGCVWVLIEVLRSIIPILGFPWLLLGHTLLYNDYLRQGADILGVYGLSFCIAAVNASLAFALPVLLPAKLRSALARAHEKPEETLPQICGRVPTHAQRLSAWRALSFAASLVLGMWAYGALRTANIEPSLVPGQPIGVIQGNIVQKLGRSDDVLWAQLEGHIALHKQLLSQAAASGDGMPVLVCWAETMVPGAYNCDPWGQVFREYVGHTGIPVLFGSNYIPIEDIGKTALDQRCFNTAYVVDGSGQELFHVYKQKLVAFGEYVPFAHSFPILRYLRSVTQDQYEPGTEASPVRNIGGYNIALNVCVEDIHPDLARESSRAGADTLINITNDGWFYQTYGPRAHLRAAAWRAIEVRRPLLRVTNTGVTAAVDPLGRITKLVHEETVGFALTRLLRIEKEKNAPLTQLTTLYMRVGEIGVGLIFLSLLFGVFWIGSQKGAETVEPGVKRM